MKRLPQFSIALVAVCILVQNSFAQNRIVEEVVVTAQKREQNAQDVPISIQAYSGEAVEAFGIETTGEMAELVPSFQVTTVAGFQLYYLRGIGTDQFIPSADPSIATYVDGIYVVQGQGNTNSLANVQRVEVLKGPQGTLFGRNSTGGAISITTEPPGDELYGELSFEQGNFNRQSVKGFIGGPLTDWLSASIAGLKSEKDSFYEAATFQVQGDESTAYRGQLNFRPSDNLTVNLTAYVADESSVAGTISENTDPSSIARILGQTDQPEDYYTTADLIARGDTKQKLYYGSLLWQTSTVDLKLLASDQRLDIEDATIDFDGTGLPLAAFSTTNEFIDLQSLELQVLSNEDTWLSDRLEWVAGLYYFESEGGFDPAYLRVGPQAFDSLLNLLGLPLKNELLSLLSVLPLDNTPLNESGLSLAFGGLLGTKSESAYFQGTWSFNNFVDLTLGGRYQREERFLTKSVTGLVNPTGGSDYSPLLEFDLDGETAYNFSPKAVLSLHPTDELMVYLSYAIGYKSGTYNIINLNSPPNYIKPEEVTSYELGFKSNLLDGNLRLNGAAFYNEITDLQSGFVSVLSGGAVRFLTAGAAETSGVEFDALWVPFPSLNPGLAINMNAAYVEATYTEFDDGSGFDPQTGIYQEGLDFDGHDIVRSPDVTAGVSVVQTIAFEDGELELAVNAYYNSGYYYDAYNTVEEEPYSTLAARVGYLYLPWNLRMTVYGKNLLEESYHLQQLQTDFGVSKTLAPPREYGVRLKWQF